MSKNRTNLKNNPKITFSFRKLIEEFKEESDPSLPKKWGGLLTVTMILKIYYYFLMLFGSVSAQIVWNFISKETRRFGYDHGFRTVRAIRPRFQPSNSRF
ncbi:hypothetical protein LEP1GSC060_2714 [Leptospira weilii serovar Ranarum str. ICFT]|uniref:Uncharacterized protein n=1 Tax=Leptospira weilii serovar Ranarum str. ICFT TaxID=1218598 RepID=N1WPZ3_9LEPT|nr:hypothetical protein [Leptospira weilii]EMY77883.1 hypothetical protein LEP1GSC060_2714 [Leptospira weilii serovar Ranarum str. ICFT]